MESWALWRAAAGNSPATAAPWRVEICQERLSEIYIDITMYIMYIYNYSHIYYMFFFIYGIRVLVRRQRRKKKEEEEEGLCVIY